MFGYIMFSKLTFCIAGDNPDLFTVKVNYGGEWVLHGKRKEYVNGEVAFFDGLSVETFSMFELYAMPSYVGVPLPVGFMYRKPGRRRQDKMDRILRDADAYKFGTDAAARVDRTGEIWLVMPDIPKAKPPPTTVKPCFLLPWIDSDSASGSNMADTQATGRTSLIIEPLNFAADDLERIDQLETLSQSEFHTAEETVNDNEGEESQFFPNNDGPYEGDNEEDLEVSPTEAANEVYINFEVSLLFLDSALQVGNEIVYF